MEIERIIVTNDLTDRNIIMTDEGLISLKNGYNAQSFPVFYGHNSSDMSAYIGKTKTSCAEIVMLKVGKEQVEIPALSIKSDIFENTPQGQDYISLVNNGAPMGASVGIMIQDYEYNEASGLIYIKRAVPYEYSETPIPTDPNTINNASFVIKGDNNDVLITSFAKWDSKYMRELPDSSYAVVENDVGARHLPFKDKEGNIDLPHLRNALSKMNQIIANGSISDEELRKKANDVLIPYAKKYLPNSQWGNTELQKEEFSMVENTNEDQNKESIDTTEQKSSNQDFSKEIAELKKQNLELSAKLEKFMSEPAYKVDFDLNNKKNEQFSFKGVFN